LRVGQRKANREKFSYENLPLADLWLHRKGEIEKQDFRKEFQEKTGLAVDLSLFEF
jgi:hypothetical protein